jgi:protein SCO1/2
MHRSARAVAAVAAVLALAGCSAQGAQESPVAHVSVHDGDNLDGTVLPKPYAVPSVGLDDSDGNPYDLATASKKPLTLVFFGYTHCPDICQVVMANIASAMTRLDDPERSRVDMVFVTTDPARDNVPVLHDYVQRFDPSFTGATGSMSHIVELATALGVPIEKGAKLPSGGYDVAHGTQILGVVPGGRAPYVWTEGTDPSALAQDIRTILAKKVRSE